MKAFVSISTLFLFISGFFYCNPIFSQNHKPIAVRDTASVVAELPLSVKVLHNDYDPEGDSIKINHVYSPKNGSAFKKNDSVLRYNSYYYTGMDSLLYDIRDSHGNISVPAWLVINVLDNPELPYANGEEAVAIACDSLLFNLTKNDTDPNGDTLVIDGNLTAINDQVLLRINDSMVLYRSFPDFSGTDTIKYRVRPKHNITLYSNYAKAVIHVTANPDIPIAMNDTVDYLSFSNLHIVPFQNDIIPTQDSMEIAIDLINPNFITINPDQSIEYHDSLWNEDYTWIMPYILRRKSDPAYYSEANIVIRYTHNPQFFYATDDTFSVSSFGYLIQDLVANDNNPDPGEPLKILYGSSGHLSDSVKYTGHTVSYYPDHRKFGRDTLVYTLISENDPVKRSMAHVYIDVESKYGEYLNINNVRALFYADGLHFFKEHAEYEVPKGSGKTSLFSNSLWIGGKDGMDSLHFAGEKHRQGPNVGPAWTKPDYYVGPVMDSAAYGRQMDSTWSYVWKLNRIDIEYHRDHYGDEGYQPIQDILTWPGNGNTSLGQSAKLAPFSDRNADGIYDPFDGDYPEIRGDQALFFIFNDDRDFHHESEGKKLKVEIQGMAYAFDRPNDTAFKNTTFLHYTVINRSEETYTGTYFGIFTDIDLGYSADDYIGCDIERNMYFGYNGTPIDGSGQSQAYGEHPPVQAVVLLGGPKIDDDGTDNPRYDNLGNQLCDESINGLYFGDSIADNERYGMRKFVYFNNSLSGVPLYMQDPMIAQDFYDIMMGIWKDSSQMIYGGNGHITSGGYGPACDFMFPGNSDSLNWGVGCSPPNGPKYWTEVTAKNNPSDRRGLASSGPVAFKLGDRQEIDIAFAWARNYTSSDPETSLIKLEGVVDEINKAFAENHLPDGTPIYGIRNHSGKDESGFMIYPNPANDRINIEFNRSGSGSLLVRIMNLQGKIIREFPVNGMNKTGLDVSDLMNGIYFVQVLCRQSVKTGKFLIAR
jgi:hypothetical protein